MAEKENKALIKHRSNKEDYQSFDREEHSSEEDGLFEHYTLIVTGGQQPMRIDKYISNLLPNTSRSKIKNASRAGTITVNDKPVKLSYKTRPNDVIKLMLPYPPPPELEAENIPLNIMYEDDDLIVVQKPPRMVVHPSIGHRTGTLIHGLLWHFQHLPQPKGETNSMRPGLVHRIDKDTSGILVIAKSEFALTHLSKQFYDRSTDRLYLALVWGDVKEDEGTIIANTGRHPKNRKIFYTFPNGESGKHAVTHYKVIERYGVATLVSCKLETGRTHQIRVHMKYLGHTLFHDTEYGGDKVLKGPKTKKYQQFIKNVMALMPRQGLHAKSLSFDHPTKKERMSFDSELPEDFQAAVDKLRGWAEYQRG
ncbi:MAG: RluA family pseudouridine synthase [Bacteroidota bacterium]